ncbi:MAG: preprotein translocase subunit YajC [Deltaproteobacteria bacterium]|nr:preprotein translocase subunit YajC [Deltaproteobacteria bacterium]
MLSTAYAMGGGGGFGAGGADPSFFVMMAVLFAIFYFLIIRPQQKKQKELKEMLTNLTYGDVILTSGGLQGKITGLTDTVVTMEIADKVRVKVSRSFVVSILQKAAKE